jgi:SAM-dependent methyltransferase
MSADNTEQISDWNGPLGQRWAQMRGEIDGIVVPFGRAALERADAQPGERAVDVGCGCGDTSFDLARRVGAGGRVLGVDVSVPMLAVARERLANAPAPQLAFVEADASGAALPAANDLLFSRFGVMFFADPVTAFAHLRRALRPGGRCVFACWRAPRDNLWAMTPLGAAREALRVTPAPADPFAPGPFAFADDARVRAMLLQAGFATVAIERFDAPVRLGPDRRTAAENASRVGPVSRLVREIGVEKLPVVVDAIEAVFAPLTAVDGSVSLPGSVWIVSAR